jgi:NADH-quinone oxidoreductase subunit E
MHLCRKLLELAGVNPERLRLEWVSASQGVRFAEVMNEFGKKIREMGPLGESEGVDPETLKRNIQTLQDLVPYIRLVERERLRIPAFSEEAYNDFFTGAEFNRLFKESIADKFEMSQMMALLREKPRTIGELSGILGISPSEVSRHLNLAARQGLGIFDESQNRIAAALTESTATEPEKRRGMAATASPNNDKIHQLIDTHQGKPGSLIHALMEIQSENHWLPKEILDKVSEKLKVPLSRVMQIATFYKIFSLTPRGRHEVQVCTGTSCHLRGASHLLASLENLTGIRPGETDANSTFSLGSSNCLGCCTLGPEILVDGKHHGRITPAEVRDVLKNVNG